MLGTFQFFSQARNYLINAVTQLRQMHKLHFIFANIVNNRHDSGWCWRIVRNALQAVDGRPQNNNVIVPKQHFARDSVPYRKIKSKSYLIKLA